MNKDQPLDNQWLARALWDLGAVTFGDFTLGGSTVLTAAKGVGASSDDGAIVFGGALELAGGSLSAASISFPCSSSPWADVCPPVLVVDVVVGVVEDAARVVVGDDVVISASPTPAAAAATTRPAARTPERPVQRNHGFLRSFTGNPFGAFAGEVAARGENLRRGIPREGERYAAAGPP